MNKHEKVRIDLSEGRACDPPMKLKKARNLYPSTNTFRLIPKFLPQLEKFVTRVEWNCVEKTLEVKILETPNFEAFAWFSTINDRYAEGQKSSFVDFEQDSLKLYFLDQQSREVACFKFKNLKLLSHECPLRTDCDTFGAGAPCDHVSHKIVIQYADHKVLPIQHAEAEAAASMDEQKAMDEEWQTVQV